MNRMYSSTRRHYLRSFLVCICKETMATRPSEQTPICINRAAAGCVSSTRACWDCLCSQIIQYSPYWLFSEITGTTWTSIFGWIFTSNKAFVVFCSHSWAFSLIIGIPTVALANKAVVCGHLKFPFPARATKQEHFKALAPTRLWKLVLSCFIRALSNW